MNNFWISPNVLSHFHFNNVAIVSKKEEQFRVKRMLFKNTPDAPPPITPKKLFLKTNKSSEIVRDLDKKTKNKIETNCLELIRNI